MTDAAPAIFVALEQSGFAAAIRQSPWLYPAANVGHIVFLVLFAGAIAVMDVRLLGGLSATAPAPLLAWARNFALAALAGMAVTGSLLFSAEANPVFQLKAILFAAGLINVAIYEFWARPVVEHIASGSSMPARAKGTGVLSLSGSQSPLAGAALPISERGRTASSTACAGGDRPDATSRSNFNDALSLVRPAGGAVPGVAVRPRQSVR